MSKTLDSLPHPLTPAILDQLVESGKFNEAHPEVVTSRWSEGEGTTTLAPAVLLVTDSKAYAVVENGAQDGYRVLERDDAKNEDRVYDALSDWCDEHGYMRQ